MQKNRTVRAARIIHAAIVVVLLGLLTGSAHGNAYQLSPAIDKPVGAGCWGVPGGPWVTCYQQKNRGFGPGGANPWDRLEFRAPMWAAPSAMIRPGVAQVPGFSSPDWEYSVSNSALYPTVPRPTHVAPIGPGEWYVSGPYTGGRRPWDFDSYQRAAIQQHPLGAVTSEVRYR